MCDEPSIIISLRIPCLLGVQEGVYGGGDSSSSSSWSSWLSLGVTPSGVPPVGVKPTGVSPSSATEVCTGVTVEEEDGLLLLLLLALVDDKCLGSYIVMGVPIGCA